MRGSGGRERGAVTLPLPWHSLAGGCVAAPAQSERCKGGFAGDSLAASPRSRISPWLAKTKRRYSVHTVLNFSGLTLLLLRTEIELTEVDYATQGEEQK